MPSHSLIPSLEFVLSVSLYFPLSSSIFVQFSNSIFLSVSVSFCVSLKFEFSLFTFSFSLSVYMVISLILYFSLSICLSRSFYPFVYLSINQCLVQILKSVYLSATNQRSFNPLSRYLAFVFASYPLSLYLLGAANASQLQSIFCICNCLSLNTFLFLNGPLTASFTSYSIRKIPIKIFELQTSSSVGSDPTTKSCPIRSLFLILS